MVSRRDILAGRAIVELGLDTANLQRGVRTLPSLLAGLGIGRAVGEAFDIGQEFERSLANAASIVNATEAQLESLAQTSLRVAREVRFSGAELNEAFFFLFSAGQTIDQANANLELVARFAQVSRTDLATAVDLLTDAQSALNLVSDDAQVNARNLQRVSDVLVRGNTIANATAAQLSEALTNKVAASARIAGVEVEELVALLTVLADQGLKGAEAGTQLSIALRELQTRFIRNPEAFQNAGIRVFDDGELRSTVEILRDLEAALGNRTALDVRRLLTELEFTEKSVNSILQLVGTSGRLAENLDTLLTNSVGATAEVAQRQLTEYDRAVIRLKSSFEELGRDLALALTDPVEGGIREVRGLINITREALNVLDEFDTRQQRRAQQFGPQPENPLSIAETIQLRTSIGVLALNREIAKFFAALGSNYNQQFVETLDASINETIDRLNQVQERLVNPTRPPAAFVPDPVQATPEEGAVDPNASGGLFGFVPGQIDTNRAGRLFGLGDRDTPIVDLLFGSQADSARAFADAFRELFEPTANIVGTVINDTVVQPINEAIRELDNELDEFQLRRLRKLADERKQINEQIEESQREQIAILERVTTASFTTTSFRQARDFLRSTGVPGRSVTEEIRDELTRIREVVEESELPASEIRDLLRRLRAV